jgi:hypothetical protein
MIIGLLNPIRWVFDHSRWAVDRTRFGPSRHATLQREKVEYRFIFDHDRWIFDRARWWGTEAMTPEELE